jgi:carbon monoxide dehydrogenase subunit G
VSWRRNANFLSKKRMAPFDTGELPETFGPSDYRAYVTMDMTGEHRIGLPLETVWRALNDPDILKASIPGCEELIRESDTGFKGRIAAAIGPVRAKFSGQATLTDIDPPNGYTLTGNGSGGAAGMVKGGAKVRLAADAEGTILSYEAHAQVAGKLAQIGSRLVDMAAKKMADEFFHNFVQQLEPVALAEAPAPPAETRKPTVTPQPQIVVATPVTEIAAVGSPTLTEPAASSPQPVESGSHKRRSWLIWGPVALIVIIIIAFLEGVI